MRSMEMSTLQYRCVPRSFYNHPLTYKSISHHSLYPHPHTHIHHPHHHRRRSHAYGTGSPCSQPHRQPVPYTYLPYPPIHSSITPSLSINPSPPFSQPHPHPSTTNPTRPNRHTTHTQPISHLLNPTPPLRHDCTLQSFRDLVN